MEKIEEKAIEYLKSIGIDGKFQVQFAGLRIKDFVNGYTTRNDEVVKMIEASIDNIFKKYYGMTPKWLAKNNEAIAELTNLLQTIKK